MAPITPSHQQLQSGWRDSNSRPPAPKAGALTKLRHIPSGQAKPTLSKPSLPGSTSQANSIAWRAGLADRRMSSSYRRWRAPARLQPAA